MMAQWPTGTLANGHMGAWSNGPTIVDTLTSVLIIPPYLALGGGFGLSAGVPWGVDFLLLLRLALRGGFRLSAGLPGGVRF